MQTPAISKREWRARRQLPCGGRAGVGAQSCSGVIGTMMITAAVLVATLVMAMATVLTRIVVVAVAVVIIIAIVIIAVVAAVVIAAVVVVLAVISAGMIAVIIWAVIGPVASKGGADGLEPAAERGRDEWCREETGECGSREQERTPSGADVGVFGGHVILSFEASGAPAERSRQLHG